MFESDDPTTVSDFGKHVWISSASGLSPDKEKTEDDSAILAIYSIKKASSGTSSDLDIALHLITPVEGVYKAFKLDVGIEDPGYIKEDSEGLTEPKTF